jgi:hypothetical protein
MITAILYTQEQEDREARYCTLGLLMIALIERLSLFVYYLVSEKGRAFIACRRHSSTHLFPPLDRQRVV